MSKREFDCSLRAGSWVRVHHGCYTFPDTWKAADAAERHRIRCLAVLRTHAQGATLSHISALVMHGADTWGFDLGAPHLTLTSSTPGSRAASANYHVGRLSEEHRVQVGGVPVTSLARAAVEHSMVASLESGLVSIDWVLRQGHVTREDLMVVREEMGAWSGARRSAMAIALGRAGSGSAGETRARFLMFRAGIPQPELQYAVADENGEFIGVVDFAWPEFGVIVEFDGKAKYSEFLRPGERPEDAVFREKVREDRIREATGWLVIRLTWADLYDVERTVARIKRALYRQ